MNYQYRVGGSLAHNHPTYVERKADRDLLNALKDGKFCYVFNCRQMGKSSSRVRVTHALQEMGMACASVDITSIGSDDNLSKWYNGVITRLFLGFNLTGKINIKTWLKDRENLSPVQRLGQFIEEVLLVYVSGRIFIFIDEIDKILSLKFSLDDFFSLIRYCYNQRAENSDYERITFALFGVATPSDLIREKTQTSFNIGEAIELTGFTLDEVKPLENGFQDKVNEPRKIIGDILDWTGGQPFLTQKICQLILDTDSIDPDVESIIRENIIHNWESKDEPVHFRTIADRLLRNERKAGRLLGIYQRILENGSIEYDDSPEQSELRLTGLVVKKDGRLFVYNPIYRAIFNPEWVKRELDKLRPYSKAIEAWKESNYTDESTLLRGQTLQNALDWSRGKSLSDLDYQFLTASQNLDKREAEIHLETERKANKILAIANRKAKRRIQIGSAVLLVSILGASLALFQVQQAWDKVEEARTGIRLQRDGDTALRQFQVESIESLVSALQAGIELQNIVRDGREFVEYPATSPMIALQQILDNIQEKNQLEGHQGTIYSVSISPDGKTIATASEDGTVKLWDRQGKLINTLKSHQGAVYSVAFSPDGERIATASEDKTARIQDLQGRILATLPGHERSVYSVNFSPDGRTLVTTSRDGTAKLWNLQGKLLHTFRGHQKSVDDASFSPDGRTIATASRDGTIKVWDLAGKLLWSLGRENIDAFYSVSFSPDGKLIAGANKDKTVKIWDNNGKLQASLVGHQDYINNVTFSPTGKFIATASSDGTAKLWSPRGKELATLRGHQESIFDVAIAQDGKRVVTGSSDRTARIWDTGNLETNSHNNTDNSAVGIDPIGSTVAIATKDGQISLLDSRGKTLHSFPSEMSSIYSLAFSPDGRAIAAVGRKGKVKIWNRQGKSRTEFLASPVPLYSVAFTPDSRQLVTGSSDGRVQRWDWQSDPPRSIDSFRADTNIIYDIALSPDGKKIASASRGTVKIRDTADNSVQALTRDSFPIYGVSFSPDGRQIATISRDGTARNWDTRGNLLAEYKIAGDIVFAIAFRPDGREISIVSRDGRVITWPVESPDHYLEKLLVRGCVWLKDYLATHPDEWEKVRDCQSFPKNRPRENGGK
ncbi:AAA-like domain-containing protein [Pannus brasiliensis CCIBt3594]|uniref:AAA-like domain-containing protein n=1 Tax=Pannus brasiliensis CCIBt3594 TaxID=1427578 RepID=A0AAW9QTN8_9CHRO